jgi:GGDEF domain-containing protein
MKKTTKRAIPYLFRLSYLYESDYGLCTEEHFQELLDLETKRALRSNTVPLLVLLDLTGFEEKTEADRVLRNAASILFSSTREIDQKGWYRYPAVLGILVTDLIAAGDILPSARDTILDRLRANLAKTIAGSDVERIGFSCQTVVSSADARRSVQPTSTWQEQQMDPFPGNRRAVGT